MFKKIAVVTRNVLFIVAGFVSLAIAESPRSPYLPDSVFKPVCTGQDFPLINLNRSVLAKDVVDREPVEIIPSLTSLDSAYEWMYFYTDVVNSAGTEIVHYWYHNGELMLKRPLKIGSDRWRTWSRKWYDGIKSGTWEIIVDDARGCRLDYQRVDIAQGAEAKPALQMLIKKGEEDKLRKTVINALLTTEFTTGHPRDCVKQLDQDYKSIVFATQVQGYNGQWLTHQWERNLKLKKTQRVKVKDGLQWITSSMQFNPMEDNGRWQVKLIDNKGNVLHSQRFTYQDSFGGEQTEPFAVSECALGNSYLLQLVKSNVSLAVFNRALESGEVIDPDNEFDKRILSVAIEQAQFDIAKFLLANSYFDINTHLGYQQETPLLLAVKLKQYEFVQWLLEHRADIHAKTAISQQDSLYIASNENDLTMLQLLLGFGANPNSLTVYEYTPLMVSAEHCAYDAVEMLLERKGNLRFSNSEGVSPTLLLLKCRESGRVDAILAKYGAIQ